MKSISLGIIILVILAITALTLWVLQFVYLIMGWYKIKNGGFSRKINPNQIEENKYDSDSIAIGEEENIVETEAGVLEDESVEVDSLITHSDSDEFETNTNKRWMLWGGIAFGVLILFIILLFTLQRSTGETENRQYVYTQSSVAYSKPEEDTEDIVEKLYFGQPLTIIDHIDGEDWVKVSFIGEGSTPREAYVRQSHLLSPGDFEILEQAGFKHDYVQEHIKSMWQRLAVVDYFKQNRGDSIKLISPDLSGICFSNKIVQGVETIAFIAGKNYTEDVLVVYTVSDDGLPILHSQNEMPKDAEGIKSISGKNGDIHVTLTPKRGNNTISISLDEGMVDEEMVTMPKATDYYDEPSGDEYTHVYTGTINGKWGIEMTLTSDGGDYYTGEYFYTNNGTPIQLRGHLTDGQSHLVMEEYVGMNMTGKFEGTLSPRHYRGTWTSADGQKSYPFEIKAK